MTMHSIDGTTHFELDHEDMDIIISGLAEVSNDGTFPVDQRTRARDLQATFHTITRLWNWWQFTAADRGGGE
ncbi:hypothetical protein ACI3QN_09110 [Propionibacterium freudenreichii]|uniref:hypothetical protein n=1 Tax=Propionibacterium freudenreichii TaxID=1744 RepID=UPI003852FBA9